MPITQSLLRVSILGLSVAPVLVLAACGEGYEAKPYYGVPYTDSRTAGHGVEWVRANMMAPKTTNTEALMRAEKPAENPVKVTPQEVPPPPAAADKVFRQHQSK